MANGIIAEIEQIARDGAARAGAASPVSTEAMLQYREKPNLDALRSRAYHDAEAKLEAYNEIVATLARETTKTLEAAMRAIDVDWRFGDRVEPASPEEARESMRLFLQQEFEEAFPRPPAPSDAASDVELPCRDDDDRDYE